MKKTISIILAMSVAAAMTSIPAMADYSESDYDITAIDYTYDDGTVTNDIDGSNAKKVTDSERLIELSDSTLFTKEFFLSFDFRFDSADDGSVPGAISIDKKKSSGAMDKQGPLFSYSEGVLRTQTGSTSYQNIAEISPDTWYTAELEGKMVTSDAKTSIKIYAYEDGRKTLISELDDLNLRQFYSASSNGSPNCVRAENVSIDNMLLISENPDTIAVTAPYDSVDAGKSVVFDYSMIRQDKEVTKHPVSWSVYNEDNTEAVTEDVSIDEAGVLIADVTAETQTVTVRAESIFGEKTLTGTKQLTINAVSTDSEKFDRIEINGSSSIKAGEQTEFTFKAYKNDTDVTETLSEEDVVWSIYDYADVFPVYEYDDSVTNRKISIENGVLTVAEDVIPQSITVRAATPSGVVYSSVPVTIDFSDNAYEKGDIIYNAYENADVAGLNKTVSVDGSNAYMATENTILWDVANHGEYLITELDVKFTTDGAGLTLKRRDGGKTNTEITYNAGNLKTNKEVLLTGADTDTWYHIELLYSSDNEDASCNIYAYNADGTLGEALTCLNIDRRNASTYGRLDIAAGTCVDNLKISTPVPNGVSLTSPSQYMFAGESKQFTASAERNKLPIKNYTGFTWEVLDSEGYPLADDKITISNQGLLTADAMAQAQTVTVCATTLNGKSDTADITIQNSEIFSVTNLGINEEGDKIIRLYVEKNFFYNDDITFVTVIRDENGVLKGLNIVETFGDRLNIGSNEITTDFTLPSDFDPQSDTVETMVWTSL